MRGSFHQADVFQDPTSIPWVGNMTEVVAAHGSMPLILNVDGSATTRAANSQALAAAGFRIREAANGGEALRQLVEAAPDLVLLAAQLPDMRTAELRRRIKRSPATASTMVLQFANGALVDDGADPYSADNYLNPSINPQALLANIRALLRLRDVERAQVDSEYRFRQLADNSDDVFWIFTPEQMIYISPAFERIWGQSAAGQYRNPLAWQDVVHPDDRERVKAAFVKFLNGSEYEEEYRLLLPAGGERWIHDRGVSSEELLDEAEASQNRRLLRVSRDISAARIADLALHEAAIRKDEFLATLAHELRNPLAPMRTAIDLMRMNSAIDDVNTGTREIISRQIDQLVRLVDDLLDVSRITQGKLLLQTEFVDIKSIIDAAIETNADLLRSRGQQLTVRQQHDSVWLQADSVRLAQVVGNLLQNAAKYTQTGGHIELAVEVHDNRLQIAIADDGIGIATNQLGHIFELFAQAERLQDKAPEGLGVGLSLVRHLVELHGGTIEAYSAGPGQGSVFTVNLPIDASLPMTARRPRGGARTMQGRVQPLRILLVDDSVDATALLKVLLEKLGHEVTVANEGHTALRVAEAFAPDVVLLDIGLPGLDGYQIAQRLKAIPALQQVPLVALTGYGQERDRERAFASGFSHHLTKPLDMDVLNDLLRRIKADPIAQH